MNKTMIAVPTLSTVYVDFMYSLIGLLARSAGKASLAVKSNSLIGQARNDLILKALDDGFERVLFIDSDMAFPADALERLEQTMDEENADLVSGLFFIRKFPTYPTIAKSIEWSRDAKSGVITHNCEFYQDYPQNKIFKIAGTGMAFTLIRCDLLKAVTEEFQASPFDQLPLLGEDYSFCWKAAKLGAKMVCDSRVKIGHIGTFVYDEEAYLSQEG